MDIDNTLLKKLEKLSALHLSSEEQERVLKDLGEVLNFANIINEIDLSNFNCNANISKSYTPLREDLALKNDAKNILFENSNTQDGYFVVPKIIE